MAHSWRLRVHPSHRSFPKSLLSRSHRGAGQQHAMRRRCLLCRLFRVAPWTVSHTWLNPILDIDTKAQHLLADCLCRFQLRLDNRCLTSRTSWLCLALACACVCDQHRHSVYERPDQFDRSCTFKERCSFLRCSSNRLYSCCCLCGILASVASVFLYTKATREMICDT